MIAGEGPNTVTDYSYGYSGCPTSSRSTMLDEPPVNIVWNTKEKKDKPKKKQWGTVNRWTKGRRFK